MPQIMLMGFLCYRCNWKWSPAVLILWGTQQYKAPTVCPHCKSPWWDMPREKDIIKIINSGIFKLYNVTPLIVFVKSHVKQGDDAGKIMECIYSLPKEPPANPKSWLEQKWLE